MAEITSCPDCSKKLRVPDDLIGKKVRCPACGEMFTARTQDEDDVDVLEEEPPRSRRPDTRPTGISDRRPPARARGREAEDDEDERPRRRRDEDDEDDRPRRRRDEDEYDDEDSGRRGRGRGDEYSARPRRRDYDDDEDDYRGSRDGSSGWSGTRFGINFAIIGGYLQLICLGLVLILYGLMMIIGGGALANFAGGGGFRGLGGVFEAAWYLMILYVLIGIVALAGTLLGLVGIVMCVQVPRLRDSPSKSLIIATISCLGGAFVCWLLGCFIGHTIAIALIIMAGLLGFASYILWVLFLRSVALDLRNRDLAGRIMQFLIYYFVYFGASIVLPLLMLCGGMVLRNAPSLLPVYGILAIVLYVAMLVCAVLLVVWLLFLMQEDRDLIGRHLARG